MSSVKLSKEIIIEAKVISKALNRSLAGQIEHWAKIGRLAEENPDLTYDFIKNILIAEQEALAGKLEPKNKHLLDELKKALKQKADIKIGLGVFDKE